MTSESGCKVDLRELKALELAARAKITFDGAAWSVPSQTSPGSNYRVLLTPAPCCTCEDFQLTNKPCKHVIAACLVRERTGLEDAPPIDTTSVPKKPTHRQVWPAYNLKFTRNILPSRDRRSVSLRDCIFFHRSAVTPPGHKLANLCGCARSFPSLCTLVVFAITYQTTAPLLTTRPS